jgi:hypothetical protein
MQKSKVRGIKHDLLCILNNEKHNKNVSWHRNNFLDTFWRYDTSIHIYQVIYIYTYNVYSCLWVYMYIYILIFTKHIMLTFVHLNNVYLHIYVNTQVM